MDEENRDLEQKQEQIGSQELIKEYIKKSQKQFSIEEIAQWYKILVVTFRQIGDKRLPYGEITQCVYEIEISELEIIKDNLTKIIEKSNEQSLCEDVKKNFDRFEDHIHLAIAQREFILKNVNKLEMQLAEKSLALEMLTKDLNEAKKALDRVKQFRASIYTEFVAILGIFTAVVLGAFGSLQVISSVFKNIKDVPTGKLLVFSSLTSIGVIILLFLLMRWINRIVHLHNGDENWSSSFKDNIVFIISLIILAYIFVLGFLLYTKEPKHILSIWYSHGWVGILTLFFVSICMVGGVLICLFVFRKDEIKSKKPS